MAEQYFLNQTPDGFNLKEWLTRYPDYKDQVKVIRESLGMTQEQLAKLVERTPRSIRTIENGEAYPRITTLEKIAGALNADLVITLIPKGKGDILAAPLEIPPQVVKEQEHSFPAEEADLVIGETD